MIKKTPDLRMAGRCTVRIGEPNIIPTGCGVA